MDPKQNGKADEPITHVEIPAGPGVEGNGSGEVEEGANAEAPRPTLAELADAGLAPGELEMAKKQGMVEGEAEDKESVKKDEKGDQSNGKEKEKDQKSVNERFRILSKGKSPEQILSEVSEKGTLSTEQETVLLANLSQNGQALYWTQKKERQKRQKLEADMTASQAENSKKIADLEAQLAKAKEKPVDDLGLEIPQEEIDPKKKPLTVEELEKFEAEKAAKAEEQSKKNTERRSELSDALNYQQEQARDRYKDEPVPFDQALSYTADILAAANSGKLEEMYPEPRMRSRIVGKCNLLLRAFANADVFNEGDFDAADMTYELSKEHPEYGKKPKNNVTKNDETGADGNPEKAARAITNASRRGSSATLTGGGSRRVALDELTPDQAVKVPTSKFNKIPKETRERLLRGR